MTNNIRLSSATRATELPQPTFRSYGAPSPIVIDPSLPTPSERDRAIGYQWRMYELGEAFFNGSTEGITFAGVKVELDKELEEGKGILLKAFDSWHQPNPVFRNECLGVPYTHTRTEPREFDKPPTAEERAEYNRRMGNDGELTIFKTRAVGRSERMLTAEEREQLYVRAKHGGTRGVSFRSE